MGLIEFIKKKKNLSYTFEDDLSTLKILGAIEKSSDSLINKTKFY